VPEYSSSRRSRVHACVRLRSVCATQARKQGWGSPCRLGRSGLAILQLDSQPILFASTAPQTQPGKLKPLGLGISPVCQSRSNGVRRDRPKAWGLHGSSVPRMSARVVDLYSEQTTGPVSQGRRYFDMRFSLHASQARLAARLLEDPVGVTSHHICAVISPPRIATDGCWQQTCFCARRGSTASAT